MKLPLVMVHGGAGKWDDEKIPIAMEHVKKAAEIAFGLLMDDSDILDAAERCTAYMESCGVLNCGLGARPNADGIRELDAMIVDGKSLQFGAVAAVKGIQNPISLARYVMEKTDHNFFAGENAERLWSRMMDEKYRSEKEKGAVDFQYAAEGADTVGCVIVDTAGNIAATSSTGGIKDKVPGRVGDSPVMGSGAYANEISGATATGYGEHIMRVVLCRMISLYVEEGLTPSDAARKGIDMFESKTGSEAGVIVGQKDGTWGVYTNTKAMPVAIIPGNPDSCQTAALRDEIEVLR